MKRSWIGLFLLIFLLAGAFLTSLAMEKLHTKNAEILERASQCALEGNWAGAAFLTAQAEHHWEKWELFRAALADHTPSEEVDALFASLEVYGSVRDKVAFSALCRELAQKVEAIGKAHSLELHNIL